MLRADRAPLRSPAVLSGADAAPGVEEHRHEVRDRQDEQQRIEAVEHATVARQDRSHVLDPEVTLDERLAEVAERGDQRAQQGEDERLAQRATDRLDADQPDDDEGHDQ